MGFFKDRSDYFKSIANANKLIAHQRNLGDGVIRKSFHRINDEEELLAACTNFAHFPCLVHVGLVGRYTGESEATKRRTSNGIIILDKGDLINLDKREQAYDNTFSIMESIISKMWNDFKTIGRCGNFDSLDLNRMSFNPVGPIGTALFGWQLSFDDDKFATGILNFDANKWFID